MDKYQELAELLKDPAKANEILSDSMEETQANLKANGLDFSIEELEDLAVKVTAQDEGELGEDALDDVSGGVAFPSYRMIRAVVKVLVPIVIKWRR